MRSLTDETATNRKGRSVGAGLYLSASGLNKSRTTRDSEEGNVSVNDGLNTFSVTVCRHRRMVYGSRRQQERNHLFNGVLRKERERDMWLRTILIVRDETRCRHIGYSFQLTVRVLLYVPSHRQDSTYHSLCYTSHM